MVVIINISVFLQLLVWRHFSMYYTDSMNIKQQTKTIEGNTCLEINNKKTALLSVYICFYTYTVVKWKKQKWLTVLRYNRKIVERDNIATVND